jgi:hypothetical protein
LCNEASVELDPICWISPVIIDLDHLYILRLLDKIIEIFGNNTLTRINIISSPKSTKLLVLKLVTKLVSSSKFWSPEFVDLFPTIWEKFVLTICPLIGIFPGEPNCIKVEQVCNIFDEAVIVFINFTERKCGISG